MKKTKILIIVFLLMLAGAIFGSVKMLKITQNQKITDFKLETQEGYNSSVMKEVLIDVEYDIGRDSELYLKYYNGEIFSHEFYKKEIDYNWLSKYPDKIYLEKDKITPPNEDWAVVEGHEYRWDKIFAPFKGLYAVIEGDRYVRVISPIVPDDFQTDIEEDNHYAFGEDLLSADDLNAYVFMKEGLLYKISFEELMSLETISMGGNYNARHVNYEPILMLPDEVDVVIGAKFREMLTVVGVGDIDDEGYTLYLYIIDYVNGKIVRREAIEKEHEHNEDNAIISGDIQTEHMDAYNMSMDVVTIMNSSGHQDMYLIEWTYNKDEAVCLDYSITDMEVSELLGDDKKICGIFDLEYKNDVVYLCYAEGVKSPVTVNEEWAKKVIANIENVGFTVDRYGELLDYNGVSIIALKDKELIYHGYLTSESYKGMTEAIDSSCIPNYWEHDYPDAVIRRIRLIAS